jgi:hypothetical protein
MNVYRKFKVKATIPSVEDKTRMVGWTFFVWATSMESAESLANEHMQQVVGGPGGVINYVRRATPRPLKGGLGGSIVAYG